MAAGCIEPSSPVILLDTSALIDSLTGPRKSAPVLERLFDEGERVSFSSLVLFEWLRGPRTRSELHAQEQVCPAESALPFGAGEAEVAAQIYRSIQRPRDRAVDICIAATAIRLKAQLWTLNPRDFADIPGLSLWRPR